VLREDLEKLDGQQRVRDAQRSLDSAVVVRPELSLKGALDHLVQNQRTLLAMVAPLFPL
jgi:hypothetical protein